MSTFPAVLGALFGAPVFQFTPKDTVADADQAKVADADSKTGVAETPQPKCEQSFGDAWAQIKEWFSGDKNDQRNAMGIALVLTIGATLACLLVCIVMVLLYYLLITYQNFKDSRKTMEQQAIETKIPYKDHIYYRVMNPSILGAHYKYRLLFYVSAVAFTLAILALLFKQQMIQVSGSAVGKNPFIPKEVGNVKCTEDDETIFSSVVFWTIMISVYMFGVFYWIVEYKYYNKITDLNAKILDFNQYIRSILPSNYEFLTIVSQPFEGTIAELDSGIFKPAFLATRPKSRDIVRTICILNLYTYYHSQRGLYTNPGGVSNVLECFNPIQRLLGANATCFSDYLINNNAYIHNHVDRYLRILNELSAESDITQAFTNNRNQILLDVDRMMAEINQRGGCLGSAYAYNLFMRMKTNLMFVVWVPILIYLGFKTRSVVQKFTSK